ncbi:KTSC domain-containing protein [Chryseobacterium sp. 7]|uniref:KTSC domain-containing protein n=1 Tax=Chryseobacterium sp. 7 TaxID=2035214 RepID=UPI000F0F29A0|nr:KTSC domain-containing protein [Chryseobacterium sp. 7]RLJ34396.1 KTSC domain-containing protein [Chryseobacterium sp. 7]
MSNCMPSSVVNHFIYFPDTEILRIIYQSGAVYDYFKVPADIIEKFKEARSKGQFLNKVIKSRFKYRKIE